MGARRKATRNSIGAAAALLLAAGLCLAWVRGASLAACPTLRLSLEPDEPNQPLTDPRDEIPVDEPPAESQPASAPAIRPTSTPHADIPEPPASQPVEPSTAPLGEPNQVAPVVEPRRIRFQPAEPVERAPASESLAFSRARNGLAKGLWQFPLGAGETLGTRLAADPRFAARFDEWIAGLPRFRALRVYSDGSCELDLRVRRAECVRWLRRQRVDVADSAGNPRGGRDSLAAGWLDAEWGAGTAWSGEAMPTDQPDGWQDVSTTGLELAQRAATADALHMLREQAGALRVGTARTLRDWIPLGGDSDSAFLSALAQRATLRSAARLGPVATADASLALAELERLLFAFAEQLPPGEAQEAIDPRELVLLNRGIVLRGHGWAPPPRSYCRGAVRPEPSERSVRLRASDAELASLLSVELAPPAAGPGLSELDGLELTRRLGAVLLRERVLSLWIGPGATVRDAANDCPTILADLEVWQQAARISPADGSTPSMRVRVSLSDARDRLASILLGCEMLE